MNFSKMAQNCFSNVVIVAIAGQVPPFTLLPEELVSVPMAIGLGVVGVSIYDEFKKVV
jgi:hypothetical protein